MQRKWHKQSRKVCLIKYFITLSHASVDINISPAVMSVDCLTILLSDVEEVRQLGLLLRVETSELESYYNKKGYVMSHMISLWLRSHPDDPASHLRDALNAIGRRDIAKKVVQLTCIGNVEKYHAHAFSDGSNMRLRSITGTKR